MSEFVAVNDSVVMFLDALKLSTNLNNINLGVKKDMVDGTTFPDSYHKFVPTVADASFQGAGFADFTDDANNEQLYARLSTQGHITSFGTDGASPGDIGYFYKSTLSNFTPIKADSPADLLKLDMTLMVDTPPMIRGMILEDSRTVRAANFTGSIIDFGTPPAGKKLYAALHVIAGTGGTLTVTVQSDDNNIMSSPATVFAFTGVTGFGQELKSGASNLQQYYRISATISGGTNWQLFVIAGYAK